MSSPRQVVPGGVYLLTRRCTQRRFLLRPDDETNNAFIYCLGYASDRTGMRVVAFIANSNHYHAVVIDVEGRFPEFLECFHKLLAKHQNALRSRSENMWASEQASVVELVGADDVLAKVVYTICNPVKDHLVEKAHNWPGATSFQATLTGKVLHANRPKNFFRRNGHMPSTISLKCVRAPGYEELTPQEYSRLLSENFDKVAEDAALERKETGRTVLGRKALLQQDPEDFPQSKKPRRVLNPRVAARDKGARAEALGRAKDFLAAYFDSRSSWIGGKSAVFPAGTYWLRRFAHIECVPFRAPPAEVALTTRAA